MLVAVSIKRSIAIVAVFVGFSVVYGTSQPNDWVTPAAVTVDKGEPALRVNLDEILIDKTNGNRTYKDTIFTGIGMHFHPNGQPMAAEAFLNGRRHGSLKKWFANGRLAFNSNYQVGRREGLTQSWWENGNQRSLTTYLNDKPEGEAWRWYRGGENFKRFNYLAGNPVGLQRAWRLNGKLFSNFEIRDGRAYGLRNSNMCVELSDEEISIQNEPNQLAPS